MKNRSAGFSLVETLLVVAIFSGIGVIAFPLYGNLQNRLSQLNEHAVLLKQAIRSSQERARSGFNDNAHGVFFEINPTGADAYISYQGNSYATRDTAQDLRVTLDGPLDITTTLPGNDVAFSKGLGAPSGNGTVTVINNQSGNSFTITIYPLGLVERN